MTPVRQECLAWSVKGTVFVGLMHILPEEESEMIRQIIKAVRKAREYRRLHGRPEARDNQAS